jgi:diguanylate cyclase (GGDEF)-like protein
MEREVDRAFRTETPLALAFLDVDGLRAVNNTRGHAAGDRMLRRVADTLRSQSRTYDLVVRYGGDEFICLFPGIEIDGATERCALVNVLLSEGAEPGSVTAGLAELRPSDSIDLLIARADADLYEKRGQERSRRS